MPTVKEFAQRYLLSEMISLAQRWGVRPFHSNPCRYADRYPENRCERFGGGDGGEAAGGEIVARNESHDREIRLRHHLSPRQVDVLLAGGLINWMKDRLT